MDLTADNGPVRRGASEDALAVLVVDDSAVNRELALSHLERLGCATSVAVNGREALAVLARAEHAAVLMDLWMPEMDGLDCARWIRQGEMGTGRHTPIVAVTSSAAADDVRACLEAGMDDHLVKPLTLDGLVRVLRRWAPNALGPRSSAAAAAPEPGAHHASAGVVDMGALARLRHDLGDDWEAVVSLVATYLAELDGRLGALRAGVDENDVGAIRLAAHTLGTTSALVGATTLAAVCRELEMMAGVDVELAPRALVRVEAAAGEVRSAFGRLERR